MGRKTHTNQPTKYFSIEKNEDTSQDFINDLKIEAFIIGIKGAYYESSADFFCRPFYWQTKYNYMHTTRS